MAMHGSGVKSKKATTPIAKLHTSTDQSWIGPFISLKQLKRGLIFVPNAKNTSLYSDIRQGRFKIESHDSMTATELEVFLSPSGRRVHEREKHKPSGCCNKQGPYVGVKRRVRLQLLHSRSVPNSTNCG
jgi:hypothetical protein